MDKRVGESINLESKFSKEQYLEVCRDEDFSKQIQDKMFGSAAMSTMQTVIIESPYSSDTEEGIIANSEYAVKCMQDSIKRGEAPFVPHLHYTLRINGTFAFEQNGQSDPTHFLGRVEGFNLTNKWRNAAWKTVFYLDKGWSNGMKAAKKYCDEHHLNYEERYLENPRVLFIIQGTNELLKSTLAQNIIGGLKLPTLAQIITHPDDILKYKTYNTLILIKQNSYVVPDKDGRTIYTITAD